MLLEEASSVKRRVYQLTLTEQPHLTNWDCKEFELPFQQAVLLSLRANKQLTQQQYVACMDRLLRQYATAA